MRDKYPLPCKDPGIGVMRAVGPVVESPSRLTNHPSADMCPPARASFPAQARIPIKWPGSLRSMFRATETVSSSQEVFSLDCSLEDSGISKVYNKATGNLVAIVVVPLVPALLWRVLYFRAIRKQVVAEALKAAHRENSGLRDLAIQVLVPQAEEDPRDFPVLYVAKPGEPPPPQRAGVLELTTGEGDDDADAGSGEQKQVLLLEAPPPPQPPETGVKRQQGAGGKASLSDELGGVDPAANGSAAVVAASGKLSARRRAVAAGGAKSSAAASSAGGTLASAIASAQRLGVANGRQNDSGGGASLGAAISGKKSGVSSQPVRQQQLAALAAGSGSKAAAGAEPKNGTDEETDKLALEAQLSALLGGGFRVWMLSDEPSAPDDSLFELQDAAADGGAEDGDTGGTGITPKSGKRRAMASSRTTTPKSGPRLLRGRSGPRGVSAGPSGKKSGRRQAAAGVSGSPSGRKRAAASASGSPSRKGLSKPSGKSSVSGQGDLSLSDDDDDDAAADGNPRDNPPQGAPGGTAGAVCEATTGAPALSEPTDGAAAAGAEAGGSSPALPRKKRIVVVRKKKGTASAAPGAAAESSDDAGPKKVVVRRVVRKVPKTPISDTGAASAGEGGDGPLSVDDVPISVGDDGAGPGRKGASPQRKRAAEFKRPPALIIKPSSAGDAPPPPPALVMPPMIASSLHGSDASYSRTGGAGAGAPVGSSTALVVATAASGSGTATGGTGRSVFRKFFGAGEGASTPGAPVTPGTATGRSRLGLQGLFGGGAESGRSGANKSGARGLSSRSHFVGDRGAGGASATNAKSSLLLLTAPKSAAKRATALGIAVPQTSARLPRLENKKEDNKLEKLMLKLSEGTQLDAEPEDLSRNYIAYCIVSIICTVFFMCVTPTRVSRAHRCTSRHFSSSCRARGAD